MIRFKSIKNVKMSYHKLYDEIYKFYLDIIIILHIFVVWKEKTQDR